MPRGAVATKPPLNALWPRCNDITASFWRALKARSRSREDAITVILFCRDLRVPVPCQLLEGVCAQKRLSSSVAERGVPEHRNCVNVTRPVESC